MIFKFYYENFKSFEKAELSMSQFTTLIGTNASGKSNAIEGIKIHSMVMTGMDLTAILDGTHSIEPLIRGGSRGCKRFRTGAFKLGCRLASHVQGKDILYEIKIGVNGRVLLEEEGLFVIDSNDEVGRGDKIFKTKAFSKDSSDIKVEYNNGKRGKNPDLLCSRTSAILPQMVNRIPRESDDENLYAKYMEKTIHVLGRILVLNPDPVMMRNYCRKTDVELRANCENISAVLYDLCKNERKKKQILDFMRRLPENEIIDIDFVGTRLGDVIFAMKERYLSSSELVDAKNLSDGTLRCIAILAAVLSVKEDSIVVVEEVDNGVHPSRLTELVRILYEIVAENNSDVVITTHNDGMIDRYNKDEIAGVSVIYREIEKGTSKIMPLTELQELPEVLVNGGVGRAMIDRKLIEVVKDSKKEKKKDDYSWLEITV